MVKKNYLLAQAFTPGVAGTLPDENQLAINAHLVNYEVYGDSIITANYNFIYDIASQCPLAGGPAVYQARTLISLINDSVTYNDAANCLLAGYYRYSSSDSAIKSFDYQILPNPNNGQFEIKFNNNLGKSAHLKVFDLMGRILFNETIVVEQSSIALNLQLNPGIYIIGIEINGQLIQIKKIAVQ